MKRHRPPSPVVRAVTVIAVTGTALVAAVSPVPAAAGPEATPAARTGAPADYGVRPGPETPPEGISDDLRPELREEALTITGPDDEPVIDLWFVRLLPPPATPPGHPLVNYGTLPEGSLLGIMQVHREHRDFRDQPVPAGVYAVRYLRQPVDGKHLGETTYRDFAVLVPAPTASSPGAQRFDVTLGQALQLNTHPFVWGLWPSSRVSTPEVPGVANYESDRWALRVDIPRDEGDPLAMALVVAGNEKSFY